MSLREKWKKQYRDIYELLYKNPRIEITAISKELGLGKSRTTASNRLKEAFDEGFIIGPQIRRKSYQNFFEYVYIVNCKNPFEMYLQYSKNKDISYHAVTEGYPNLWVISKEKINIEGDVLVSGLRSDYHISFPPHHTWKTSVRIINNKIGKFNPDEYQPQNILKNHWDKTIDWSRKDEILFRKLKYNLRKPLTPIMKKHRISGEKTWNWLKRLPECCSIITEYYPESIAAYDPYLYIFETDYEDFLIDLFSQLPTSCWFFKVSDRLILYAYLDRELLRSGGKRRISDVSKLHIPLLTRDLLKKGFIRNKIQAIVDYHWGKRT